VAGTVEGRVGGAVMGSNIRVALAEGRPSGRFGGAIGGKDVQLSFDGDVLTGRWGGAVDGKDLRFVIRGNEGRGRMGGHILGWDIAMVMDGDQICGRLGGAVAGADVRLTARDGRLTGRIGGATFGKDCNLQVDGVPYLVAAAVAAIVYFQTYLDSSYEPDRSASAAPPPVFRRARKALGHPSAKALAAVWLLAAATLALRGFPGLLLQIVATAVAMTVGTVLILYWLTPDPPPSTAPTHGRAALWGQVGLLLAAVLLTGVSGMQFHHVAPTGWEQIPLWTPVERALERAGGALFGIGNWVRNPVLYMVMPGAILILCRVKPVELGLCKGYRSWAAAAPFLLLTAVVAVARLAAGGPRAVLWLPFAMLDNFLQNGFVEEFLFRGALQTRLHALVGEGWSLVLSSLLFGVWHLGLTTAMLGGDYLAGLAMGIVSQGTIGLMLGMLAQRTRSLIAPTVAHITVNLLG